MYLNYKDKKFGAKSLEVIQQARAFCEEYAANGYDLTLRQLYYRFVAEGLMPNKQQEYKRLGSIINDARLAGLIDWDHVVDRTRNLAQLSTWQSPEQIVRAIGQSYRLARWDNQPHYVEVWVEKEALAGVVARAADLYGVPHFACRGYVSQSEQWAAAQRLGQRLRGGQDVTVIHLGDHDPSGVDMTRDNYDRLNDFVRRDSHNQLYEAGVIGAQVTRGDIWDAMDEHYGSHLVTVERIALNMDQIDEYDPPPNPAKFTDSRARDYIAEHGYESWELDALPPDVLNRLIVEEIEAHIEWDAWHEVQEREDTEAELLTKVSTHWSDVRRYLEALDA